VTSTRSPRSARLRLSSEVSGCHEIDRMGIDGEAVCQYSSERYFAASVEVGSCDCARRRTGVVEVHRVFVEGDRSRMCSPATIVVTPVPSLFAWRMAPAPGPWDTTAYTARKSESRPTACASTEAPGSNGNLTGAAVSPSRGTSASRTWSRGRSGRGCAESASEFARSGRANREQRVRAVLAGARPRALPEVWARSLLPRVGQDGDDCLARRGRCGGLG
jgi:hypothetical protein